MIREEVKEKSNPNGRNMDKADYEAYGFGVCNQRVGDEPGNPERREKHR